jgi:hypothetical protein
MSVVPHINSIELYRSDMFRPPDYLLVGTCNADRMERDVAAEIQHIPAGTTFVDGASLGLSRDEAINIALLTELFVSKYE